MIRSSAVKQFFAPVLIFLLAVLLLLRPTAAAAGISEGLLRCAHSMIPALFPFLVLSEILVQGGYDTSARVLFAPFCHVLRCRTADGGIALLMGLLGGFTAGSSALAALLSENRISKRDAEVMLCACAGISPAFAVSVVGASLLRNAALGWILFLALVFSSLLCCIAVSLFLPPSYITDPPCLAAPTRKPTFSILFVRAVNTATQNMLYICGFVVFFNLLGALLQTTAFGASYSAALPLLLELSAGCHAACMRTSDQLIGCLFSMSTLGICGLTQLRALLPHEISLLPFFLSRIVQFPLALWFTKLAMRFLPTIARTTENFSSRLIVTSSLPWEG
ncbi:MAG: hypothetical protein RSF90_06485, partial [Pygmaiobacter sp.]